MPSSSSDRPDRTILSDKPMVLVSHASGRMYPVEGISVTYMENGQVQLNIVGGMQGHGGQYLCQKYSFSVSEKSDGRITVYFTEDGSIRSYTIRPAVEDDAAWMFPLFGIPLPVEAVEQIITNSMELSRREGFLMFAGTPAVWAFTTKGEIGAVAFNIQDVDTFFRVDGKWTRESPIEIDDTDSVTITPTKAAEFLDRWDEEDDTLFSDLDHYAIEEEK